MEYWHTYHMYSYIECASSLVREATRSAAMELGYPDLKPEQLEVVEIFVKGHSVCCAPNRLWEESLLRLP